MNFNELRQKIIELATVNGEYKSGKMNSRACVELKTLIDEFVIPGFTTRSHKIFAFLHGLEEAPRCHCGVYLQISSNQRLQTFCSPKCSANSKSTKEKRANTNIGKYGGISPMCNQEILAKTQATNLQKYGTPSSWAAADIRNKAAQTNLQKYGVENPAQAASIRKKISLIQQNHTPEQRAQKQINTIQTNLFRYGVERAVSTPEVKKKIANSFITGWAERNLDEYLERIYEKTNVIPLFSKWEGLDKSYRWKHDICNREFDAVARNGRNINCPFCKKKSKVQEYVQNFVAESGLPFIVEDRTLIGPHELDIVIPNKNVAIEVNGIFWHHAESRQKPLLYKTEKYSGLLLHFWDYEIVRKPDIVRSMILSKLGLLSKLAARKTKIYKPTTQEARAFFEKYHLQGHAQASELIGLEYRGELVACASFGRPRFSKSYDWELIRFASADITVVGGLSKILAAFSKGKTGQTLLSFADRRFSKGHAYLAVGFKQLGFTTPNYFYFKGDMILPRWKAMKHKLKNIVADFDESLSERELMLRDGWLRCMDCGNIKLEKIL